MAQRRAVTSNVTPVKQGTHSRLYFSTPPPAQLLLTYMSLCSWDIPSLLTSKIRDLPSEEFNIVVAKTFSAIMKKTITAPADSRASMIFLFTAHYETVLVSEESNLINDSHEVDECWNLSAMLKRLRWSHHWVSEGLLTGQWAQTRVVWHRPMHLHRSLSSLSSPQDLALCNPKRPIYHLFKVTIALSLSLFLPLSISLSLFLSLFLSVSLSLSLSVPLSLIPFPLNTHISNQSWPKTKGLFCVPLWNCCVPPHPGPPLAVAFTPGQPCVHHVTRTSESAPSEDPQQCRWLMLRDSPCLFKWQCCNDSRRQTDWRQDPLDYFVSDIKRSSYTQWERSRTRTMSAATLKLTQL